MLVWYGSHLTVIKGGEEEEDHVLGFRRTRRRRGGVDAEASSGDGFRVKNAWAHSAWAHGV